MTSRRKATAAPRPPFGSIAYFLDLLRDETAGIFTTGDLDMYVIAAMTVALSPSDPREKPETTLEYARSLLAAAEIVRREIIDRGDLS